MTIKLDTREARPLTSREISKLLCATISGAVTVEPAQAEHVEGLLVFLRAKYRGEDPPGWETLPTTEEVMAAVATGKMPSGAPLKAGWQSAVAGLIGGMVGWCSKKNVDDAITWTLEHLHEVLGILKPGASA